MEEVYTDTFLTSVQQLVLFVREGPGSGGEAEAAAREAGDACATEQLLLLGGSHSSE